MQNGHNACIAQIKTFLLHALKQESIMVVLITLIFNPTLFVGFGMAPLPSNAYKSYDRLTKKMYL